MSKTTICHPKRVADLFIHIVYNYRMGAQIIFNPWRTTMEVKKIDDLFMSNGNLNSAISIAL